MNTTESLFQMGGSGPNILFIHGYCSDRQSWVGTAPSLFDHGTVWGLDLPAHGKSTLPVGDGSIAFLTKTIAEIIRETTVKQWHIVGHSLGGRIAIELAAENPDLVESLVLIAPAAIGSGVNSHFMQALYGASDLDEISALLMQLVNEPKMISAMVAKGLLKFLEQPNTRESLACITEGLMVSDSTIDEKIDALVSYSLPVLTLWGNDDRINPPDSQRIEKLPGKHHFLDHCGHLPHIEKRLQVNQLLEDFFAEVFASC